MNSADFISQLFESLKIIKKRPGAIKFNFSRLEIEKLHV